MNRARLLATPMLAVFLGGCGGSEPECEGLAAGEPQDWCRFERVGSSLEAGRLEEALADVALIQAPVARAAAVDRILSSKPGGLTSAQAASLCGSLSGEAAQTCRQRWNRPHLWDQ